MLTPSLVQVAGSEVLADAGLLALRVTVGLLVVGHAVQKSFGWLGGDGLTATAAVFERVGYTPGRRMVLLASVSEIAGATLLMVGAVTPVAGAVLMAVMLVACSVHWPYGVWAARRGFELPLTFAAIAGCLSLVGPGRWSVDHLVRLEPSAWFTAGALVLALLGAAGAIGRRSLVLRRRPVVQPDGTH